MLPEYPQFRPLGPEDQGLVTEFLALTPRTTCDLALANLFIWRACEAPSLTLIKDNLCILLKSHAEPQYFLEPLGKNDVLETVEICLRHAGRVSRAGTGIAGQLPADRFHVVPLRDHFDYIYEVRSLAELKGKKYDGKRNQIRKFTRLHPGYQFSPLEQKQAEQALALFDRWSHEREDLNGKSALPPVTILCQRHALQEAFASFDRLGLQGGAIFVDGTMEGLIVTSAATPETATAHLQYANYKIPGIYQVLLWETCRQILSSFTFLNLEEDLGIAGLRKTKLSYQPVRLEEKFLITLR
jgi:hypothetical protein